MIRPDIRLTVDSRMVARNWPDMIDITSAAWDAIEPAKQVEGHEILFTVSNGWARYAIANVAERKARLVKAHFLYRDDAVDEVVRK